MKFVLNLIVVSVIAIIALVKFYEIEGIDGLHLKRRESSAGVVQDLRAMFSSATAEPGSGFSAPGGQPLPSLPGVGVQTVSSRQGAPGTIRLGTFNLREFSREKVNDPKTMDFIVRLLQQIDLIAVQEVDADRRELFPRIVEYLNRDGRTYDFIAGPQVGPDGYQQLLGFIFDRQRVEADLKQTYTVTDPANQIAYEPLVGWFRTVGVDPLDAWTFSLANVYVDPDNPQKELELLTLLFHSIQHDGRGEDDVILAGCFFAGDHELARFASADIRFALEGTPSDIHAQRQTANLLFNRNNTTEFLGESGAIDFLRQYNLTIAEAEAISDHLPVWAEFQIREAIQF
ncbi:endonuclease/exonuclease/phosphatase family protein [Rosistilla oblonga]|uniref:Endonuclease/exonuclease/phosphatase domain-containing protein n=1 Tax=Rosistilla oblonga TaxID=2527990 RepID=A0A518IS76_9BACT|nr:endonuclease/exonuclease/phosphatase family protein [Rosistilla oblonga]QDV55956.1 hypothetical protein Mal33_19350 [Rosistilla oblonga]